MKKTIFILMLYKINQKLIMSSININFYTYTVKAIRFKNPFLDRIKGF